MKRFLKKVLVAISVIVIAVSIMPITQADAAVKLSATKKTVCVGESFALKVNGTSKTVKWSSSSKSVANVTQKGKVTAKKAGKATITAKVSSKSLKCVVTVREKLERQIEITEYSYENTIGDTLYFLIAKNKSKETVRISVNAVAKDSTGKLIGADDASENAIGSGQEACICCYFDGVINADSFSYTINVEVDKYYESAVKDLSIEESRTDDKVILVCTNNGEKPVRFVEAYALFFKNGELIRYDSTYITDSDSEIKPGATLAKELDCYDSYDDVKIYISGRR